MGAAAAEAPRAVRSKPQLDRAPAAAAAAAASAPAPPMHPSPPTFDIDLDAVPEDRWRTVALAFAPAWPQLLALLAVSVPRQAAARRAQEAALAAAFVARLGADSMAELRGLATHANMPLMAILLLHLACALILSVWVFHVTALSFWFPFPRHV